MAPNLFRSERSEMGPATSWMRKSGSSTSSRGPDDDNVFLRRQETVNALGKKQRASFMHTDGAEQVTRLEMVRYLALQRWSRKGCVEIWLPLLIWVMFLNVFNVHAHTVPSFHIRGALTHYVHGMVADLTRGVPPVRTFSNDIKQQVNCKCSCALGATDALCGSTGTRNFRFDGRLSLQQLAQLRVRSGYNASEAATGKVLRWNQLGNMDDVWFWVQHAFVPEVWQEVSRNSAVNLTTYFPAGLGGGSASTNSTVDPAMPKVLLQWHQLVAGVRLRQFRLEQDACAIGAEVSAMYGKRCFSDAPALRPYGPGLLAYAEGFVPETSAPGAYDAFLDLQLPVASAIEKLEHTLKDYRWLDDASASLTLQAMLFNAEASPPLLGSMEVHFRFDRSGGLRHQVSVRTTAATTPGSGSIEGLLDYIWLGLVAVLVIRQVSRIIAWVTRPKSRVQAPMCSFFILVDWATVVGSVAMVVNFLLLAAETSYVVERVVALPPAPQGVGPTSEAIQQYHESWGAVLDLVLALTSWAEWNRMYLFWYTLLLTFQFLASFRSQPKLAQLGRVLTEAAEDLWHFIVFFLAIFLNFAFAGFMIFGAYIEGWSSAFQAMNTTLQIVMGFIDINEMYDVAPTSTILWFIGLAGSLIFICLNLLVATLYDNYVAVKARMGSGTGIVDQAVFLLKDLWSRGSLSPCCCCRRRGAHPSHGLLLEEIMARSGLDRKERQQVHSSVLGAVWNRREMENIAFSYATDEAHHKIHLGQGSAQTDLYEMGIDDDYTEDLLEHCQRYLAAEYDFDEQRERQLRELVVLAEGEMHAMKERLAECEGFTGEKMEDLATRLETFEATVHDALHDLVDVAEGANISAKANVGPASSSPSRRGKLDAMVLSMRSLPASMKSQGVLGSSSVKGVMEHLSELAPSSGTDMLKSRRRSRVALATVKEETAPWMSTESWHKALKVVSPHGKRARVSARKEWEDK